MLVCLIAASTTFTIPAASPVRPRIDKIVASYLDMLDGISREEVTDMVLRMESLDVAESTLRKWQTARLEVLAYMGAYSDHIEEILRLVDWLDRAVPHNPGLMFGA